MKTIKIYKHPEHGEKTNAELKQFAFDYAHSFNINEWEEFVEYVPTQNEKLIVEAIQMLRKHGMDDSDIYTVVKNVIVYSKSKWTWDSFNDLIVAVLESKC